MLIVTCFIAVLISLIDLRFHRIPRLLAPISLLLLTPWITYASLIFGLLNYLFFLFLFISVRNGIGYGDVRLAFLIGILFCVKACPRSMSSLIALDLLAFSIATIFLALNWRETKTRVAFAPAFFVALALFRIN